MKGGELGGPARGSHSVRRNSSFFLRKILSHLSAGQRVTHVVLSTVKWVTGWADFIWIRIRNFLRFLKFIYSIYFKVIPIPIRPNCVQYQSPSRPSLSGTKEPRKTLWLESSREQIMGKCLSLSILDSSTVTRHGLTCSVRHLSSHYKLKIANLTLSDQQTVWHQKYFIFLLGKNNSILSQTSRWKTIEQIIWSDEEGWSLDQKMRTCLHFTIHLEHSKGVKSGKSCSGRDHQHMTIAF